MSLAAVATALAAVVTYCCTAGHPGSVEAADTVSARRPLRGNDTVVSARGKFELGLFSPGNSGRYYLGIWYTRTSLSRPSSGWVANRATPLSGVASTELRVSPDDGNNLELIGLSRSDASPGVVWSSNLSASTGSSSVAVMRDNGNLMLLGGGNSSNVLWQSFDHPTDTLAPEAWLGQNKLTGSLTSWRDAEDPAPRGCSRTRWTTTAAASSSTSGTGPAPVPFVVALLV
ncbi:unnamed protein product [Urochloa humidicola]